MEKEINNAKKKKKGGLYLVERGFFFIKALEHGENRLSVGLLHTLLLFEVSTTSNETKRANTNLRWAFCLVGWRGID
jgi:hypothetical protein